MDLLSPALAKGHLIELRRTDPRHLAATAASAVSAAPETPEESFGKLLFQALNRVSEMDLKANRLEQAMLTDPDSVDIHDVTVALAEAELAITMTKGFIDRAIRAYREILNIR